MQTNDHNYSSNHDYSSISPQPSPADPIQNTQAKSINSLEVPLSVEQNQNLGLTIPLLEERLKVHHRRQKVGEVVIRREVETHIIEVPVRREKLIVEQVNPEFRQLATIDLTDEENSPLKAADHSTEQTLKASYSSVEDASRALDMIAEALAAHCHSVNVTLLLQRGTITEQTTHQFGAPTTASQMLGAIASSFTHQCHRVDLDIVANREELQRVYQHWVQQRTTHSSALAGARNFSVS